MTERWLAVAGYDGLYEVSDHGRVRSLGWEKLGREGRVLKPRLMHAGYLTVDLSKEKVVVHHRVHRRVARAFLGEPPTPDAQVNHKNSKRADNELSNLEWCSQSSNMLHAHYVTKTGIGRRGPPRAVIATKGAEKLSFRSISEAMQAGFHGSAISQCCMGRWAHHRGYTWRYAA